MLDNVTIGQYFPGDSPVHRMDPRMKLILTVAYVIMLFIAKNIAALAVGVIFVLVAFWLSDISFRLALRSVRAIIPIILFTAILNMFFVDGKILFEFGFIKITDVGINTAILMSLRIVALITGTSLLTYTTSPIALTDGIEKLFAPLNRLHVPVHEVAMMMTIALRFIPTLIEETQKIMSAQKARGADMESGGIIQRIKAMIPVLIPLFVSAFRRADELALAMESRSYRGGEGRTKMRQFHFSGVDFVALFIVIVAFAATILLNQYASFLVF